VNHALERRSDIQTPCM